MKKFLSLVLALVMTMSLVTVSAGAKDFADDSSITYKEAVDVISGIGIVDGYSDGSFGPDGALTRGAAAKIICNLILGPTTASALSASTAPFKDVPTTNVFAGYITYCAQQGIISGYGDGTFRPTGTLTGNAFMKMLLGALGYDSSIEGYTGSNWSINVVKQALGIGLDDGNDNFVGSKAVTRQEAALYAFNMLQATMVEYDSKSTVVVGDVTINTSSTRSEVANSGDEGIKNDNLMQFAERYFNQLDKTETTDDFARPATKWTYKGDKIGTYADAPDATYTSNVELGDIYSDLGMSEKDANAEVYYNGVEADEVAVSRNNTVKISTSGGANDKLVADGSDVEVFYDEDHNDVTICIIDTYVGTISSKEEKVADPYVVVNAESIITKEDGTTTISISGNKARFETDIANFEEDDVVLFTYSQSADEIKSVEKAESVTGTLDKYTLGKNLTLGDTEYKYSKNIAWGFGAETSMTTKSDYTVYLDANGYAIYVDEQEFDPSQYAFVLYTQSSNSRFGKDQVQLIMSNGDVKTVDTDDDYTSLEGTIVYYRADDKGEYSLREAANVHKNGTITVTADGSIATDGVLSGGVTNFSMQNTRAAITTGAGTVYGNSETVFVVAETNASGKTDYSVYTGIKNAPTIMSNSPAGVSPAITSQKVEMVYTTSGNSDVVTFAFIDATNAYVTNGKNDVVFLAGESVTKLITDSNNNQYYLYNAVVDDTITTVMVKAVQDSGSAVTAGSDNNMVVTNAEYNNKNLLKYAENLSSSDYDVITESTHGTGVWKLSGSYSIGLGGSTASASIRYTMASDAKMYHEIRRASDRLCREHGLSVIVPGRDKGKSYIEHQAAQNGISYKAKLKAAIDRLIPVSSSLEDLIVRLQRGGYEIKRGKYVSARAPDQERFTRLKTLGADYTEEAVVSRIAGGPRPSRQPRQRSGKVNLLIDIQNNIKAQQSAGYQRWATIENLKRAAATMNFLTEHGIGSYEELVERCDAVAAALIRTRESLRDTEQRIADLALLGKQIDTYRKLKPVYDRYKVSKDKEKFLRGFESEIILFEAAAREIKKAGLTKLPSYEKLKAELDGLSARKTALQAELRKIQRVEKECDIVLQNVCDLLDSPQLRSHLHNYEIE